MQPYAAFPENVDQLLDGSDFRGSRSEWRESRELFNSFIPSNRDVLDVGCANGLLLASLLAWRSRGSFTPWGFDIRYDRIQCAKTIFPQHQENFWIHDMFKEPWLNGVVDIVIAPWVDDKAFLNLCLRHSRSHVLFSAYDDEPWLHGSIPEKCSRRGLVIEDRAHVAERPQCSSCLVQMGDEASKHSWDVAVLLRNKVR